MGIGSRYLISGIQLIKIKQIINNINNDKLLNIINGIEKNQKVGESYDSLSNDITKIKFIDKNVLLDNISPNLLHNYRIVFHNSTINLLLNNNFSLNILKFINDNFSRCDRVDFKIDDKYKYICNIHIKDTDTFITIIRINNPLRDIDPSWNFKWELYLNNILISDSNKSLNDIFIKYKQYIISLANLSKQDVLNKFGIKE